MTDHKITSDGRAYARDFSFDKIEMDVITNPDSLYQALKTGQIDFMARYISPDQLSDAQNDPNLEVVSSLDFGFYYLAFNLKKPDKPFLANRLFRHAIAYLIDRDYIVNTLLQGQGIALATPVPPCYGDYSVQNVDGTLKDITIIADTNGDGKNETRTPADFERTYTFNITKAAQILD
jgi:ABC-type transport system substrate-binding protein